MKILGHFKILCQPGPTIPALNFGLVAVKVEDGVVKDGAVESDEPL
jgi:hypothetical protein